LDHIGMAEARLIQGELEEAARLGHEAAAIIEQTRSDRVRVKLVELYQHSTAHATVPAIAELRDRVRSLVTTPPIARRPPGKDNRATYRRRWTPEPARSQPALGPGSDYQSTRAACR